MGNYIKKAGIYRIECILSQKSYIGYSENINKRWDKHKYQLRRDCHTNSHLQNAWNLYKEEGFIFSIIEPLPIGLSKEEYELIETKWILHFQSHLSEKGYNACLPGSIPLKAENENKSKVGKRITCPVITINVISKEIVRFESFTEASKSINISNKIIAKMVDYWCDKPNSKKVYNRYIVVREKDYNPEFDYINFKKARKLKDGIKKTWRDYYDKEKKRKNPLDIIPYSERNLKRISIIAVNIDSGEEKEYISIKEAANNFNIMKIRKCIKAPFKKYKHRGHYFKAK